MLVSRIKSTFLNDANINYLVHFRLFNLFVNVVLLSKSDKMTTKETALVYFLNYKEIL